MILLKYLFLGFIQGITETLPISSSGHLLIFKTLMNVDIDFDILAIITNFGSLIAIIILFRKDIVKLINSFIKYLKNGDKEYKNDFKYCILIILGCIPAGIMGLIIKKFNILDMIENNVKVVGISLIITSILLYIVRNFNGTKNANKIMPKDALKVGSFQILGLLPGISRSGSTIVGGMFAGLTRDEAFRYSFLLYIPMSLAASLLEIKDLFEVQLTSSVLIYCGLAAIIAGIMTFLTTKWFRKIVNEGKLIYFSLYCLIVGLLVIVIL